jgi:hypothetical protein
MSQAQAHPKNDNWPASSFEDDVDLIFGVILGMLMDGL